MTATRILIAATATLPLLLTGCELAPKSSKQLGYRGAGMDQVTNTKLAAKAGTIPANAYATPDDSGPRASSQYKNLQVLGNISADRFNHMMSNINNWVVPQTGLPVSEQGCNYCHNPNNMASDEKYTKVVARRMIQMTQNINANWTSHVQQTGVTCYTCHRGHAVPQYKWAMADTAKSMGNARVNTGQNHPEAAVGYTSLPGDPFSTYLKDDGVNHIRVAATQALPSPDHKVSIKTAETTYGLMIHISQGLGVNCTYCHNTQSFRAWNLSSAARVRAWHGLRMVAATNAEYMTPLGSVFPAVHSSVSPTEYRKGPNGDVYKINCQTCHQGVNKPLGGVSMRDQAPALFTAGWAAPAAPSAVAPAAPAAAPAATTAQ